MAVLERINELRQQGKSDAQISTALAEERFNPQQINEGLSQSQIKSAISQELPPLQSKSSNEMMPSISNENPPQQQISQIPTQQISQTQQIEPQTQEQYSQYPNQWQQAQYYDEQAYADPGQGQGQPAQYYDEQAYADQSQYPGDAQGGYQGDAQGGYPQETYYQQALDPESIREIAKQVVEEELGKTKEQMQEIIKLKTELKFQIENMDMRLKRIETTIQELQSAIIGKMGSYGDAISDISSELKATQESFGKLINPIIDAKRSIRTSEKSEPKTKSKKTNSSRENGSDSGFEDYFR